MRKFDLDTPCLVLDLDLLEANLRLMQQRVSAAGKQLRPHAKTHKCSRLARLQLDCGAVGLCVAKVSEADALMAAGIADVLITGPVVGPHKIERLLGCLRRDDTLTVVVDSARQIHALGEAVLSEGLTLNVLVAVDVGLHRVGVAPDGALPLARLVDDAKGLSLRGIQAYAGHVQHVQGFDARRGASHEAMACAVEVFHAMRKDGLPVETFSGAGTGTHDIDLSIAELTELQAGSYALMDAEYLAIGGPGGAERFDAFKPALTLLTTVVSVNSAFGTPSSAPGKTGTVHAPLAGLGQSPPEAQSPHVFVTVDAGLKTVYHHGARPLVLAPGEGRWTYDWFGDEYGKVAWPDGDNPPHEGDAIELVVGHCDPTVNLFDRYHVVRGDEVVDEWTIDLRGCSQ